VVGGGAEEEAEPRCRTASAAADAGSSWSTQLRRPSRKILTVHARVARGRRGRHPVEARAGGGVAKGSGLAAHGVVREGERVREPGGKRERGTVGLQRPQEWVTGKADCILQLVLQQLLECE
jgi:hypothetical protein